MPQVLFNNIKQKYSTDWYVTESDLLTLRNDFVYQNAPVPAGDILAGMYYGIKKDHFDHFMQGGKNYYAIAVSEAVLKRINSHR